MQHSMLTTVSEGVFDGHTGNGERGYYVLTDARVNIYDPNKHLTWKKCKSNTEQCQFGSAYFFICGF